MLFRSQLEGETYLLHSFYKILYAHLLRQFYQLSGKMAKTAFLFAGQGSQYIGMGKDIYSQSKEAKEVYDRANETLGFDLSGICFDGKQEELNKTSICQPAVMVTSIALLRAFKERNNGNISCHVTAGLSLGEYTALVFANSISFEDALSLVL